MPGKQFPSTPHAKRCKIVSGTIRADDGTTKGPGDTIVVAADQVGRFPGQLEFVEDVPEEPAADASSSAGSGSFGG